MKTIKANALKNPLKLSLDEADKLLTILNHVEVPDASRREFELFVKRIYGRARQARIRAGLPTRRS